MNEYSDFSLYLSALSEAFERLEFSCRPASPLGRVSDEIGEMVASYLSDAACFQNHQDLVNEYASLAYAHGWLDAGIHLGFFSGSSPEMYRARASGFPADQQERLLEKTYRYHRMLTDASVSVSIAPEYGSPLYHTASAILETVRPGDLVKMGDAGMDGSDPALLLGVLSYRYGWLDAGLRSGLYRIIAHPELFPTAPARW